MRAVRRILLLVVFAGLFWVAWRFTHDNDAVVPVDLLGVRTLLLPTWVALLAAFAAGALGVFLVLLVPLARTRLVARRFRKELSGLESEIHQLRNLPLAADEGAAATAVGAGGDDRVDRSA